jgi:Flp pilus assembly protein TadG
MRRWRLRRQDGGSTSIELAILTPSVISVFIMVMMGGEINMGKQAVEAAAFDAARTASRSRDADAARDNARIAATNRLLRQGVVCNQAPDRIVSVDVSEFESDPGVPAEVTVTVTCTINFSDIALPGMPGTYEYTATFVSPLDLYRERNGPG